MIKEKTLLIVLNYHFNFWVIYFQWTAIAHEVWKGYKISAKVNDIVFSNCKCKLQFINFLTLYYVLVASFYIVFTMSNWTKQNERSVKFSLKRKRLIPGIININFCFAFIVIIFFKFRYKFQQNLDSAYTYTWQISERHLFRYAFFI